jgi:hypothetical protein
MTTQPRNYNHPRDKKEPEKKHPYLFYWLTGGLATIIAAIIAVSISHSSSSSGNPTPTGPSTTSPGPSVTTPGSSNSSPGTTVLSGNGLLTSDDMGETAGGFWSSLAADAQSLSFSCFPLPGNPIKSAAVELESGSGAKLWEVVDTFSSAGSASQAYTSFANTANNCSWQSTSNLGTTSKFTAVPDSNAPSLDSASGLWDLQGAPEGSLDVAPSHDGAFIAVQSGKFVAFAQVAVDASNNPSLTVLESNIEPAMASAL